MFCSFCKAITPPNASSGIEQPPIVEANTSDIALTSNVVADASVSTYLIQETQESQIEHLAITIPSSNTVDNVVATSTNAIIDLNSFVFVSSDSKTTEEVDKGFWGTCKKFFKTHKPIFEGIIVSLEIFFFTLLFSLPLALPICFGRMSKIWVIRKPIELFLLIMRGTPLILQLLVVFFVPGILFPGIKMDRFCAAIVAFSINYAAFFAEIYRGGIESIPVGQYEAGKVLGFTKTQTFFRIILPQVIKRIIPSTANEVMTLVKDTALAMTIGVAELFRAAQTISSREFSVVPLFVAGVVYFLLNWIVDIFFRFIERKLNYYK